MPTLTRLSRSRLAVLLAVVAVSGCVVPRGAAVQSVPLGVERRVVSTEVHRRLVLGPSEASALILRAEQTRVELVRERVRSRVTRLRPRYNALADLFLEPFVGAFGMCLLALVLFLPDMRPSKCVAGHPGREHRFTLAERAGILLLPGIQAQTDASGASNSTEVEYGRWRKTKTIRREPAPRGTAVSVAGRAYRVGAGGLLRLPFSKLLPDLAPGHTREVRVAWGEAQLSLLVTSPHPARPRWSVRQGEGSVPPLDDLHEPNDVLDRASPLAAPPADGQRRAGELVLRSGNVDWFFLAGRRSLRRFGVRLLSEDPRLRLVIGEGGLQASSSARTISFEQLDAELPVPFRVVGGRERATYALELRDLGSLADDDLEDDDSPAQARVFVPGRRSLRALDPDWFQASVPPLHACTLSLRFGGAERQRLAAAVTATLEGESLPLVTSALGCAGLRLSGFEVRDRLLRWGIDPKDEAAPYAVELELRPLPASGVEAHARVLRAEGRFASAAKLYLALRGYAPGGAVPSLRQRSGWTLTAARCLLHAGDLDRAEALLRELAASAQASVAAREAASRRLSQIAAGRLEPALFKGLLGASASLERGILAKDPALLRDAMRRSARLPAPSADVLRAFQRALESEAALGVRRGRK